MQDPSLPAIVVFSRNRPLLLRRLAVFHAAYEGELIIVDGSADPVGDLRLPPNGVYLHRPGMSIGRRIAEGVGRVRSPFCALSADDDYMLHRGLAACGRALEEDPGLVCATGTVAYFWSGVAAPDRAIADEAVERAMNLRGQGDASDRFLEAAMAAPSLFYSCLRTSASMRVARLLADVPDDSGLVAEQLRVLLPSVLGRTRMIDQLMLCRRKVLVKNASRYKVAFRAMGDISEWEGFDATRAQILELAVETGAGVEAGERIVETWRRFAAGTKRGRMGRKQAKAASGMAMLRGLLRGFRVASDPRLWRDLERRSQARDAVTRVLLRCSAYPWRDPLARAEFERTMQFDIAMQSGEQRLDGPRPQATPGAPEAADAKLSVGATMRR